jgi:hypothetical protein
MTRVEDIGVQRQPQKKAVIAGLVPAIHVPASRGASSNTIIHDVSCAGMPSAEI